MPQPHKGRRVKLTVRLPYDLAAECAVRAKARRWNMSEYIGWCVENTLNPIGVRADERRDPTQQHYGNAYQHERRVRQAQSG